MSDVYDERLINGDATLLDNDWKLFGRDNIEHAYAMPPRHCALRPGFLAVVPRALPPELHHFPVCICETCRKHHDLKASLTRPLGATSGFVAPSHMRVALGEDWCMWCHAWATAPRRSKRYVVDEAAAERLAALEALVRLVEPGAAARAAVAAALAGTDW